MFDNRNYTSDGHSRIEYFRLEPNGKTTLGLTAIDGWGPLGGVDCGYCDAQSSGECYPCENTGTWNIRCSCDDAPEGGCADEMGLDHGPGMILQTEAL